MAVKSHSSFATVREMKYSAQHCYDKTIDDKMIANARRLFSELYTIVGSSFRMSYGVDRPNSLPHWIRPCRQH